jgi:hypothetical protein
MAARDVDRRLSELLAELWPHREDVVGRARRAGIEPEELRLTGSVANMWDEVVHYARVRGLTAALIHEAQSDHALPELEELRRAELRTGNRALDSMGEIITDHLDKMRQEMREMEKRISARIDAVEGKVDRLQAVSIMYTAKKRTAWLVGFLLFALPCMLLIQEVRQAVDLSPAGAGLVVAVVWTASCALLMYGIGLLRDL